MVNNSHLRILTVSILFAVIKPSFCFSQEKVGNYFIQLKAGAPRSTSGITFSTYWFPVIDISLSGLKCFKNNWQTGIELDYSRFYIDESTGLESDFAIINPNLTAAYGFRIFKKLQLLPEISLGYSWMNFMNSTIPNIYSKSYNESGVSLKPGVSLNYLFKDRYILGLFSSYKIIFNRFGSDNLTLFNNEKEAACTSYLILGFNLGFYF